MTRRFIHYEAAFEDYVRSCGWPYVAVNEQKRAIFAGARVKSFDFLVYPPGELGWLVDVKGRKFPYEGAGGKRYWENWVTRDDLKGLEQWKGVFGEGYEPILVFAYWLCGYHDIDPSPHVHLFRNESYAFLFVRASEYAAHARTRSPKWQTVSVPRPAFRSLVRPIPARLDGFTVGAGRI